MAWISKQKFFNRFLPIIISVILVAAAGFGYWLFFAHAGGGTGGNGTNGFFVQQGGKFRQVGGKIEIGRKVANVPISFAQKAAVSDGGVSSTTAVTVLPNASSTDMIIVSVGFCTNVGCTSPITAAPTVTDSQHNTFSLATSTSVQEGLSYWYSGIFYAPNMSSGDDTITITSNAGVFYLLGWTSEWKGILTSSPLDRVGVRGGNSTNPTVTTSLATTQASELIYAFGETFAATSAAVSPFTAINSSIGTMDEYNIVSSTGTFTANWTAASNVWWALQATFK